MLGRVDLAITDVSEEHIASIIRVTRIGELGSKLAVTSNQNTLGKKYYVGMEANVVYRRCSYLTGNTPMGHHGVTEIALLIFYCR
jgi:hypothetical protein